jgi:transcriptional regulator with XRE-family HTH domain
MRVMATMTRAYVEREAAYRGPRQRQRLADEVRRLVLDAGVTLAELGRTIGADPSHLSRVIRGISRPSDDLLLRIGIALGSDPSFRYFPTEGPRVRDRFQAPMVEALIRAIDRRWAPTVEVPVSDPRGIIDIVLEERDGTTIVAGESCSEITRLEEIVRRSGEKADGLARRFAEDRRRLEVSRLLIVRSTEHNRAVARRYHATLHAAYPAITRDVVAALTTPDLPWPGPGIVWMRLEGGQATLLPFPPRGVILGR